MRQPSAAGAGAETAERRNGMIHTADEGARCLDCGKPAIKSSVWPLGGFTSYCAEHAMFPSARVCLEAGLAVRQGRKGWAIYPAWGEFDLFPGDEGPQRELSLDEALAGIGGDQGCVLAPAGRAVWPTLDQATRERVLNGQEAPTPQPITPDGSAGVSADELLSAAGVLCALAVDGKVSLAECQPILSAIRATLSAN